MQTEKRFYPIERGEIRLENRGEGVAPIVHGMAPPFNSWSPIRGDMQERFAPDAFAGSDEDVIATIEHDNRAIFGRVSAGTLTIEDREDGAYYSAELGTRSYELDLIQSLARGEIRGSSFEFYTVEDEWDQEPIEGATIWKRTVKKAVRVQVGPVARPFYDDSTAVLRSLEEFIGQLPPPATPELYAQWERILQRRLDIAPR